MVADKLPGLRPPALGLWTIRHKKSSSDGICMNLMSMSGGKYWLSISCRNQPGIVAQITKNIYEMGGDIIDARQFDDLLSGNFFMRVEFTCSRQSSGLSQWRSTFIPIVEQFGLTWSLRPAQERRRVLLMVSKFDHCLEDILYRHRIGELPMDVTAIVSNYPRHELKALARYDFEFHHLPVTPQNKSEQELRLLDIILSTSTDLVILARYMQVLSDKLCAQLIGRCINVHHSFLPGFKGAKPYHQAHERGVKLIGATCHFVTGDLDEGPIIEQEVIRVSHADSPNDLVRKGRDVERQVLARGLRYVLEDRVSLNGKTTVVFPD